MISDKFEGAWGVMDVTTDDEAILRAYVHEPSQVSKKQANGKPASDEHPGDEQTSTATVTYVLAHGWTLNHRSWYKVANRLVADDDVRVIVWDQRGHGHSTLQDGKVMAGDQTMARLADDIAVVLTKVVPPHSPIVLVGHSLGGMAVLTFAARHTELLHERVIGVALVGTSVDKVAIVDLPGGTPLLKIADVLPIRPGKLVPTTIEKWLAFGPNANDEDAEDLAAQTGATRLSTTGAFFEAVRDLNAVDALPALDGVPVAVIVGEHDRLTPVEQSELIAQRVSTAHLEIVPEAGHVVLYERPDEVHRILRALGRYAVRHAT